MKSRVVVGALITYKGKILMGQKPKDIGPYPNVWHLPGGGIEGEESFEEAVKREVEEETGLIINEFQKLTFDEDVEPNKKGELTHYIFLIFKCESQTLKVKPGDDIVKLKWFSESDLKNIPMTRPSIKYFKEIGLI
jgi:8-oxo-dGTP diphosphatase